MYFMRSKRLLLLLLLAIVAPWAAMAQQALPYSYGFEDNNLANDGWTTQNPSGLDASGFMISTDAKRTGEYGFQFSSHDDYGAHTQYLISPELNAARGVIAQFYYRKSTSNGTETFKVGYSTTDTNIASFTFGSEIANSSISWTQSEEYTFPAGTKYVAIYYYSDYKYYLYVDDFSFTAPASCPKPTGLTCTEVTANTAKLSWTETGEATNWVIEYGTASDFTGANTVNVSTNPYTLTGLTAETEYYARVKADCGGGDQSVWSDPCEFKPTAVQTVAIGSGIAQFTALPIHTYYKYSYSQQIYTAAEIGQAGIIKSVSFKGDEPCTRELVIYMANTAKETFSAITDYIPISQATQVFSGSVTFTANNWTTIELTGDGFDYDGTNLAIIVDDNSGNDDMGSTSWAAFVTTDTSKGLCFYQDDTDINPASPNASHYDVTSSRNQIILGVLPTSTPKPRYLTVSNITASSATFSWEAPSSAMPTGYEYQVKQASEEWPTDWINTQGYTSIEYTPLDANTDYNVRVRAIYAEGYSNPAETIFTTLATCLPPIGLAANTITSNSAVLTWTAGGSETTWNLLWKKATETEYTTETGLTALVYTLQNLEANTEYDARVQADCGGGDLSVESEVVSFRTACEVISNFPWSENFDSYTSGDNVLPTCWNYINTTTYGSCQVYPMIYSSSSNSTPNNLRFYSFYANLIYDYDPKPQYAILPEMNGLAGKAVTLWAKGYNTSSTFKVGTMADPTNASTFSLIAEQTGLTTSYQKFSYNIPSNCTDSYLVIMIDGASLNEIPNGVYIDDISIDWPVTVLTSVEPYGAGTTGNFIGTLTVDNNQATQGQTVTVTPTPRDGYKLLTLTASPASVTLTPSGNTYTYTQPAETVTLNAVFAPEAPAITISSRNPWTDDFTSYTDGWGSNTYRTFTAVNDNAYALPQTVTTATGSFSMAPRLWKNSEDTWISMQAIADKAIIAALPEFNNDLMDLSVSFNCKIEGSGSVDLGYYNCTNGSFTLLRTFSPAANATEELACVVADKVAEGITTLPGSNYRIAFRYANANSIACDIYSVTVGMEAPCVAPTGFAVSNVTATGATLTWTPGSNETDWVVEYGTAADFTGATSVNVSTNPFTLTGLTAETEYYARVKADCESNWSSTASFRTPCAALTTFPITYGFETSEGFPSNDPRPTNNPLGTCWRNEATVQNGYNADFVWGTSNFYKHNGSQSLVLFYKGKGSKTMLVFPEMEFTNANGYIVSFWIFRDTDYSNPEGFKLYVSDCDTIGPNAVELGHYSHNYTIAYPDIVASPGWYQYETEPITMTGSVYLIFEGQSYFRSSTYVDDITITEAPSCLKPTNLAYSEVTAHTVKLSWTNGAEGQNAWQICLNNDEDDLIEVVANDLTDGAYTLAGLDAETAYTAKVRANCGEGDFSDWSNVVSFTTAIACHAPTSLISSGTAHTDTLSWNGTSESYTVKYRRQEYYVNGVNEQFGTAIPTGWTMYEGLLSTVMNGGALTPYFYAWDFGTKNGVFDNHARVDVENDNQRWLVTPSFELNSSTFTFDLALTAYSGSNVPAPQTTGTDDKFVVLISTDNKATWTILRQWDNEEGSTYVYNNIANTATGEQVSIDLSSYVGQTVCIAFYGESTVYNADNNVHIDNVVIGNPDHIVPEWTTVTTTETTVILSGLAANTQYEVKLNGDCGDEGPSTVVTSTFTTHEGNLLPMDLQLVAGSLGSHQATVSWTGDYTNDLHESFDLYYSTESTMPEELDEANLITGLTEASYTLTDLEQETQYYVWVRDNCGTDGISDWSYSYPFTTTGPCPTPTHLAASNLTSTTADLSWIGSPDVEMYTVRYREAALIQESIFSEGFENGMGNWTMRNCDISSGISSDLDYVHSGNAAFVFKYNYNPPQYLISPELTDITEGMKLEFYYKNASTTWSETFQVGFSSTDNATESFTFGEEYTASDAQWHCFSETIPAGTKYICWKLNSNDKFYLYIDDIAVGMEVPAGEWNTSTAAATTLQVTGLTPETKYEAIVKSNCSEDEWSDAIYFTTTEPVFTKTIEAYGTSERGGYYLIASPVSNDVTPAVANGFITETATDYDLYYFDQDVMDGLEWVNFKDDTDGDFDIENGTGYLYANKNGTTLTFTGTPYSGNGEVTLTKTAGASFAGWNLVGNPFAQQAYADRAYYALQNGEELTAKTSSDAIGAMEGVFVTAANAEDVSMTFSTTAPGKSATLTMNVVKGAGSATLLDRAIVSFGGGSQLPKFQLRASSTKVYIPQEGKDYAIVSAANVGEVPVSFKAENNGTYTLSFTNEEVTFAYLHLIDNMTGTETDLLATPSYSFEARTTDYESRFKLVFATGNNANDDAFAFYSNGSFVINNDGEATLQVIDVNGRVLKSESINGCANVDVKAAAGVYMLRLVNRNDVKVQKVVVR